MFVLADTRALCDKNWEAHVARQTAGERTLVSTDHCFIHEANSARAFSGSGRVRCEVRGPDLKFALTDFTVPINNRPLPIIVDEAKANSQFDALSRRCRESGIAQVIGSLRVEK